MSNPLVCQILGGVLALFFIFLLVMCWKTWRIMHILSAFFLFAAVCTFLAFSSFVLKTQAAWRKHYESHKVTIAKEETEQIKLLQGDLIAVQQAEDCIRSARAKLADEELDRGRVWRECTPMAAVDADTFRVKTVPASQPAGQAPEPSGIAAQMVLYVFAEKDSKDGWKVPGHYLGEFAVDEATDAEVTISATIPLDPDQIQHIQQGGATWALYEVMPVDSHEAFAEMDPAEKRLMGISKEALAEFFPNAFNWPADQYDKFLDTFARFNRDVTDKDSPDDTWVLVKFLKKHTIPVDSDTAQSLLEGEARYFDSSGRAVEARLRRGEDGTVTFEIGDSGCFDLDSATALIDDGICEKVKPVYRRQLHDYARFFRETYYRHRELDESILRQKRDTDILVGLKTNVEAQAAAKQMDKDKLASDLVGFKTELGEVTAYTQMLDAEWEKSRTRLSELYRRNLELSAELTQLQSQLADEINRRAAEAAGTPRPTAAPPAAAPPAAAPPAATAPAAAPSPSEPAASETIPPPAGAPAAAATETPPAAP
jgi:hypothetical protein